MGFVSSAPKTEVVLTVTKKYDLEIDEELCKGCGICVDFCPKKVFENSDRINPRGYYQPVIVKADGCVGCRLCELLCPELAIVITECSYHFARRRRSKRRRRK